MVSEHVLSALAPKCKSRQSNDALQNTAVGMEQRTCQMEMQIWEEFRRKSPHIDSALGFVLNHLVADCSPAWSGLNQTSKARGRISSLMIVLAQSAVAYQLPASKVPNLFVFLCLSIHVVQRANL